MGVAERLINQTHRLVGAVRQHREDLHEREQGLLGLDELHRKHDACKCLACPQRPVSASQCPGRLSLTPAQIDATLAHGGRRRELTCRNVDMSSSFELGDCRKMDLMSAATWAARTQGACLESQQGQ